MSLRIDKKISRRMSVFSYAFLMNFTLNIKTWMKRLLRHFFNPVILVTANLFCKLDTVLALSDTNFYECTCVCL